jgi:hypothetical protein
MAVLKLYREPGGNEIYRPWYHLVLEKRWNHLFCPQVWEQLFPNMTLEPGESREVEIDIKFVEMK